MSKKKQHHEEHADETWLLPYSDLLTLLLALFIVMFAMSNMDKQKFEKISNEFNVIFSGGSGIIEGGQSAIPSIEGKAGAKSNSEVEDDKMIQIKEKIEKEIGSNGYSDEIHVALNREGLEISIQDAVLFNSGEAEVLKEVSPLLLQISKVLNSLDNDIKVVGYTDDRAIRTAKYRSNWDLSAMRAINVMNFLVEQGNLQPDRFSIQGFGQYAPKYDNATEEGRAKNRRVEIFLVRKYPLNNEKNTTPIAKPE